MNNINLLMLMLKKILVENKLNLNFNNKETEKNFVEKINIFGNNITKENVIRNQFEIDEGDPLMKF